MAEKAALGGWPADGWPVVLNLSPCCGAASRFAADGPARIACTECGGEWWPEWNGGTKMPKEQPMAVVVRLTLTPRQTRALAYALNAKDLNSQQAHAWAQQELSNAIDDLVADLADAEEFTKGAEGNDGKSTRE